jgi:hypothetical protein
MALDDGNVARPLPWRGTAFGVLATFAIWLAELLPEPWSTLTRQLLHTIARPSGGLVLVLSIAWVVMVAVRARTAEPASDGALDEEPLLAPPNVVACRSSAPIVLAVGLEPSAGVSTLTFNLAVALAVFGRGQDQSEPRSARPACVLTEGALTDALHLSPIPLDDYMDQHRFAITPGVVNLAVRHASGAELYCLKYDGVAIEHLLPLVSELRRWYDAVLVDGWRGHGQLIDVAVDHGDALLLVGLPTSASLQATGPWVERVWGLGLEGKTALVVNKVMAWPALHPVLKLSFLYHAQLPHDRHVPTNDASGLPWSLDERLPIAAEAATIVRQLFPTLIPGAGSDES